MDDKALLDYFHSGGDVKALPDTDLNRLMELTKALETADVVSKTPPGLQSLAQNPNNANTKLELTPEQGKAIGKWLAARSAETLTGIATGGLGFVPRVGLNMGVGALTGAAEGDNAVGNALKQGEIEGGGALLSSLPYVGNALAIILGGARGKMKGVPLSEMVDSFLRQRSRGLGQGIPVGDTLAAKAAREKAGENLQLIEEATPGKMSPFDARGANKDLLDRSVNSSRASDLFKNLSQDEVEFILQQLERRGAGKAVAGVTGTRVGASTGPLGITSGGHPLGRTQQALDILQQMGVDTPMTVREGMELGRSQSKAGQKIIEARRTKQWIPPDQSAMMQAEAARGKQLTETGKTRIRAVGPEHAKSWEDTNKQLQDLYMIERVNNATQPAGTLGATSARMGLGYGGGLTASVIGGLPAKALGTVGALTGLVASPRNLSRAANVLGRTGSVSPTTMRLAEIINEIIRRQNPEQVEP